MTIVETSACSSLAAAAMAAAFAATLSAQASHQADFCRVESKGTAVLADRPAADEAPIDDVNWFARPVPNPGGRWIVAFASHDQNYLYDLSRGRRVKVPDKSDAVATPDGRYITVPSHYTPNHTVNFYDAATLLARLDEGKDALDVKPAFAHRRRRRLRPLLPVRRRGVRRSRRRPQRPRSTG